MVASYEAALQTRTQRHDGACQLDRVDCDDPPYHLEFLAWLNRARDRARTTPTIHHDCDRAAKEFFQSVVSGFFRTTIIAGSSPLVDLSQI